jgi:hypothetical protein
MLALMKPPRRLEAKALAFPEGDGLVMSIFRQLRNTIRRRIRSQR